MSGFAGKPAQAIFVTGSRTARIGVVRVTGGTLFGADNLGEKTEWVLSDL